MKKSFDILVIANKLDNQGKHEQADMLTRNAMQRLAAGNNLSLGPPPRRAGDYMGELGQTGLKAVSPYFGNAAKQLLSPETALQRTTNDYIKQLSPEQNKIRDQLQKGSPGGLEQSSAIQTYDPETGKAMAGGKSVDEIMPSMAKYLKNPSYMEALLKSIGGQAVHQLGYSDASGSQGLKGIGNMPYLNSVRGNLGDYVTNPAQGG